MKSDEEVEHPLRISNPEIFSEYEKVQQTEFLSSMLMVHLADTFLSPTGLMIFNGTKNAMIGSKKGAPLEHVAKGTVMQMSLNLSVNKLREDIVYENSCITTFACDNLMQERLK